MLDKIQSFFGFTTMPFGRGLAPGMLFRSHDHAQAVARIAYGITSRGITVITGEVGVGKTVAARAAIDRAEPARYHLIYIPDPTVGARGIYHHVVTALGGKPSFHNAALVPQARDALAAEHAERGRVPIVCIDEGHLLSHEALEALRLLTNHQLDTESPFATIVLGQPTLATKMKLGTLAALEQRITVRRHMTGMTSQETADYVHHHVKLAGRADPLFTDDAIALIHQSQPRQTAQREPAGDLRAHRRLRRRQKPRRRNQRPLRRHREQPRPPARDTLTTTATACPPKPRPNRFGRGSLMPEPASPATTPPCARSTTRQHQTLRKATAALTELAARLARGRTRRPPAKVQAEIDTICAPRWVARVIATELTGDTPATLRLAWRIDQNAHAALEEEIFGKRILVTDHNDWPLEQVIDAYRSQEYLEAGFRQAKDPHVVSFAPIRHFTDHKIRVHLFTCVLALAIAHLMRREATRAGLPMSVPALLAELEGIGETVLLYQGERGRPRARHTITRMTPTQQHLYTTFDLAQYAPHR